MSTPRSTSYLNGLWVTGYTPTQADFQDLFASYDNIVDDNILIGNQQAITGVYPSNQGTAYQLTKRNNIINAEGGGISAVKLPPALSGAVCFVSIAAITNADIYPTLGDTILPLSVNVNATLTTGYMYMFVCSKDGYWRVITNQEGFLQYKIFRALVSQTGTADPTLIVLLNTLGGVPTIARTGVGTYVLTLAGAFPQTKSFMQLTSIDQGIRVGIGNNSEPDSVVLSTGIVSGGAADSFLYYNPLEIKVYQ